MNKALLEKNETEMACLGKCYVEEVNSSRKGKLNHRR